MGCLLPEKAGHHLPVVLESISHNDEEAGPIFLPESEAKKERIGLGGRLGPLHRGT